MTERKSKSGSTLHQLKIHHQQQIQQLKQEFEQSLLAVEEALQSLFYSQCFYHEAIINLLTSDSKPDSDSIIGAIIIQRQLQESSQSALHQLTAIRHQTQQ